MGSGLQTAVRQAGGLKLEGALRALKAPLEPLSVTLVQGGLLSESVAMCVTNPPPEISHWYHQLAIEFPASSSALSLETAGEAEWEVSTDEGRERFQPGTARELLDGEESVQELRSLSPKDRLSRIETAISERLHVKYAARGPARGATRVRRSPACPCHTWPRSHAVHLCPAPACAHSLFTAVRDAKAQSIAITPLGTSDQGLDPASVCAGFAAAVLRDLRNNPQTPLRVRIACADRKVLALVHVARDAIVQRLFH